MICYNIHLHKYILTYADFPAQPQASQKAPLQSPPLLCVFYTWLHLHACTAQLQKSPFHESRQTWHRPSSSPPPICFPPHESRQTSRCPFQESWQTWHGPSIHYKGGGKRGNPVSLSQSLFTSHDKRNFVRHLCQRKKRKETYLL